MLFSCRDAGPVLVARSFPMQVCSECGWVHSYALSHVYAWVGILTCTLTCVSRGVRVCKRERTRVQRKCVHAMQVCMPYSAPYSARALFTRRLLHAQSLSRSDQIELSPPPHTPKCALSA